MPSNSTTRLPVVFCLLVEFPDSHEDCVEVESESGYSKKCYNCPYLGRFLTGDMLDTQYFSLGRIICIVLWIFVVFVGIFGICMNCLIINIIRKHQPKKSFDLLLTVLALFDLFSSFTSVIAATAMVTYFEGWNRGPVTLFLYYLPFLLCLFGRTGSAYMTVLITIERYLVIAKPFRSGTWLTSKTTKVMTLIVIIFAILLNIPRLSSVTVKYNETGQDIPSLYGREYIISSTALEEFWYKSLKSVHYQIDIWVPFPLLILFNALLFIEIKKFTRRRQEISSQLKGDIRAARMFVPVVLVLFLCNIEPISHYAILHFTNMYYRELVMGLILSISINSAANLPIYARGQMSFRQEIKAALPPVLKGLKFFQDGIPSNVEVSRTTGKAPPVEQWRYA